HLRRKSHRGGGAETRVQGGDGNFPGQSQDKAKGRHGDAGGSSFDALLTYNRGRNGWACFQISAKKPAMKTRASIPSADAIVRERLFQSFFLGGFECSTHHRRAGLRLDLIAATRHDQFALADYQRLRDVGIRTVREGVRWHLVEAKPGCYDFSSVKPIARAA